MAIAMDATFHFDLPSYSTTTTTSTLEDREDGCNWNEWSPVVDWAALSHEHNDFDNLIDSSMVDDHYEYVPYAFENVTNQIIVAEKSSNLESESESSDSDVRANEEESNGEENLKGLRLVHLLLAAAEAFSGGNDSKELARVILVRLRELVSANNGTTMERLAAYFTEALQSLLEGHSGNNNNSSNSHRDDRHRSDFLAAFQLLQDMSPYIKFGHFTANQAILEAVAEDKRIHVVDYDIMEGIQWSSLMQALVSSRKDGQPAPYLRITALSRGNSSRRSIGTVQETGRRLAAFAESIGLPFSFHQCRLDSDETFRPSALKLIRGEALVFNCMLHLPHFSNRMPNSVASFLSGAKMLNPRVVAMVEEEVGRTIDGGFIGRFMEILHHYSAVFDSLEAGFPMQVRARALVEKVFLGPRIAGSLGRIYQTWREEEVASWWERIGGGGLGLNPVNISFANHCQAKLLVGLFNDGYRVEELGSNRLVLGWKSKCLLSASIWTC